jgi:hypothetical protein
VLPRKNFFTFSAIRELLRLVGGKSSGKEKRGTGQCPADGPEFRGWTSG